MLSSDGSTLWYLPHEQPAGFWSETDWLTPWRLARWTPHTDEHPEVEDSPAGPSALILGVGPNKMIVQLTPPDARLPLEKGGCGLMGPAYREGISVFDPASGSSELLVLGLAPKCFDWRWD